jgi:LemA protein
MPLLILGVIVLAVLLYIVSDYNSLASMRAHIQAAMQEIGNQLKRQAELNPNLEASAKAYLKHEKDILKMLADARKLIAAGKDASAKVSDVLPKLQVVVESNPQMKGADVISRLMDELRDTADKVMYARRTLIDLSADYNVRLVTFPSSIVANMFGFKPEAGLRMPENKDFLVVSDAELKTPKVSL